MTRSDAARAVKARYADYLQPARKHGTYICPICGNGTGDTGDGMAVDPHGDGTQLKCFKCGFYGDVVDLYQQQHGCTTGEAFQAMYNFFGIEIDDTRNAPGAARTATEQRTGLARVEAAAEDVQAVKGVQDAQSVPDNTRYYQTCQGHINDPAAREYLNLRGISQDTAARFYMGYDPGSSRLIIPVSRSFYVARSIDPQEPVRYRNPTGAKSDIFNLAALHEAASRPVFVVEGAIDALSIIEAGGQAVGLNSTGNIGKLIDDLRQRGTESTLIIGLDNDDAGQRAAAQLAAALQELNIDYVQGDVCGQYKDPNERLTSDRSGLIKAVQDAERQTVKPDNTADYITGRMDADIEGLRAQSNRKTGFYNLDAEAGSIYAGLYAIGGISSVGKTTFCHQLADQMAAQGQHVLFFSMEQSRLEMVSKSIARQTAKDDPDKAVSSLQIRTGAMGASIKRATAEYLQSVGDRVSIIEGNFRCTVSFIGQYVRRYIARNGVKPVVFVDYLQVLQAEKDPETGRKSTDTRQIVDHNVTELKRLSRDLEIPVFVVSSVNRSNYLAPIDFESFKESGGIEYTADVVWGLQLAVIHDPIFEKEKDIVKKRARIAEAKEAMPREIELVCLKNRYGKSRYAAQFTYYPQYDYFTTAARPKYTADTFYK